MNGAFAARLLRSDFLLALVFSLLITFSLSLNFLIHHKAAAPFNLLAGCCGWEWTPNDEIENVVPSDVVDYYLPNRFYLKEAVDEGSIPLWNPETLGGEVFQATTQSAVLHPINALLHFFSPSTVQTISTLSAIFFTLFSTVLMLRSFGLSRQASLLGAAALGFSSFALFWSPFGMTWFLAAMSAVLYFYNEWKKTQNNNFAVLAALALGAQFYFGHIQFAFMVYLVFSSIVLYDIVTNFKSIKPKTVATMLVTAAIGVAIGAAQILPFLEQAGLGHRAAHTMNLEKDFPSAAQDIVNFFKPYTFQIENKQYFKDIGIYSFNLGFIASCLALVAVLMRKVKGTRKIYFVCLVVLGLLWSWGSLPHIVAGAVSPAFKQLNPRYFIAIAVFAAAALTAIGYDYVRSFASRRVLKYRFANLFTLGFASAATVLITIYISRISDAIRISPKLALVTGLAVLAFWFSTQVRQKRRKIIPGPIGAAVLIAFIVLEGALLFNSIVPANKKTILATGNPYHQAIIADSGDSNPRNTRIVTPYAPNTNMYYGLSILNGYEPLYAKKIEIFIDNLNHPLQTRKLAAANAIYIDNLEKGNILKSLGVKYIIVEKGKLIPGYNTIRQIEDSPMALYRSDTEAAQLYFADRVTGASPGQQLEVIKNNLMGQKEVLVEEENLAAAFANQKGNGLVTYDIGINKIKVSTQSDQKNLLFIAQNYHTGWTTRIDGKPAAIHRATVNFMAIEVPEGSHSVELNFMPNSFKYGAAITVASLLATASASGWIFYRRRIKTRI